MADWASTPTPTYAGIGARLTPPPMLELCERVAGALAAAGWRLRSGHGQGADSAFERGAAGAAYIFPPWPTFRAGEPVHGRCFDAPEPAAYAVAETHHPKWGALRRGGRSLHARNCHEMLGWSLDDPVRFVICWTSSGAVDGRARSGGTGQAIRLAIACGVPVFNLARADHRDRVSRWLHERASAADARPALAAAAPFADAPRTRHEKEQV